jgi:hypothetical protein
MNKIATFFLYSLGCFAQQVQSPLEASFQTYNELKNKKRTGSDERGY